MENEIIGKRKNGVAAVIVTRNRINLLQEAVYAIKNASIVPDFVIVVDNASSDGTAAWLSMQEAVCVVAGDNKFGCAGGFSDGIRRAFELGADSVWIMDDDCIPTESALGALLSVKKHHPDQGFYCSQVTTPGGIMGNQPVLLKGHDIMCWNDLLSNGLVRVRSCSFVSVLISMAVVLRVGLPQKELFIWGDDVEYTFRISKLANHGLLVGSSLVLHKVATHATWRLGRETSLGRIVLYKYKIRNDILISRRYGWPGGGLVVGLDIIRQTVRSLMAKDYRAVRLKAIFLGLVNAIRNPNPSVELLR